MKNRFLLILSTILLMLILVVKGETEVGKVSGKNPNAIVTFDSKVDNSYTIIAEATGDWIFTDDFSWSGPNGWYSDSKYIISCERFDFAHKPTAFVDASLIFGASMNGKMYVPGGEGGSPIPWTVSAAYHLAPTPCLTPILSIIAKGNTCQLLYGYDVSGINPGGYWKYTGTTVTNETISEGWGNNIGSLYTTPSTLEAGQYTFTAARNSQGAFSSQATVNIIGVKQLFATSGSTTVTSITETPGDDETLYIPKGTSSITITATPEPGSMWPDDYPTWKVNGTTTGTTGSATYSLSISTAGNYTVSATCGNSIKAIKIVIFEVNIYAETSAGITNDGTMQSLAECMENRDITYTAKVSDDIPAGVSKTFIFYLKTAAGVAWNATVNTTSNSANYIATAGLVGDSPTQTAHKFTTPIYVTVAIENGTATSDTINIDVYELWIKDFKDASTGKNWKVCVGENISYEAIASNDCKTWNWDMEEGVPDAWNPTGGNSKSGSGMKIPYSDLARASNSWFGDRYGEVNVSCYDAEDNFHRKYSTDMRGTYVKADVFFPPDVNVDGGTPSSSKPPCWFVFWKDGNVVNTMNSTQWYYQAGLYGAYSGNIIYLGPLAWTTNSGNETRLNRRTSAYVTFTGSGDYLDCVSETMVHEKYHSYSDNTWGGLGIRTGHTDSDGLPDTQEDTPSTYNGAIFPVTFPNNSDTYSYGYPLSGGNDYNDQEIRCRIVELNGKLPIDKSKDWAACNKNPKW